MLVAAQMVTSSEKTDYALTTFLSTWVEQGGSERSNYQLFIQGLCSVIGVAPPQRSTGKPEQDSYIFEKRVNRFDFDGTSTANFIDCYKRGCFVLEAKQSPKRRAPPSDVGDLFGKAAPQRLAKPARARTLAWDQFMRQARAQAERYAKALPEEEGWPTFLIIVDVGEAIELYADFSGLGKAYMPFPDSMTNRIWIDDLVRPDVRELLKKVWEHPRSLNPAIRRAEVTRDIAERLAILARGLEARHPLREVSEFLMRCVFTAFAEEVQLLKGKKGFIQILKEAREYPAELPSYVERLWQHMDTGTKHSPDIGGPIRQFNGGLFKGAHALPLKVEELDELIVALQKDWTKVEPAIFGTLLENALTKRDRGKFGAHFTPRAYVERLVIPTVIEPLMEDWGDALARTNKAQSAGDSAGAIKIVKEFHATLCKIRILDPACGTANFLYVTLEHLKRLEADVLMALRELGVSPQQDLDLAGLTVTPEQLIGLEINPRAVPIAELVIWIGYLQWHLRERDADSLGEPILKPYETIKEADAVLAWRDTQAVMNLDGTPATRWNGYSYRVDPLTNRAVPDTTKCVPHVRYLQPRLATWPKADFIVGNPPFIAGKDLRRELGDGYAEAIWAAYKRRVQPAADYVMYWWDKAAELVKVGEVRRFGFITTNSITHKFSRRVIQRHLKGRKSITLAFAIPNHPWTEGVGAASVRIAMTVGTSERGEGVLKQVEWEGDIPEGDGAVPVTLKERKGMIAADLTIGPFVGAAVSLAANTRICSRGVSLHGDGFLLTPAEARTLGLGSIVGLEDHVRFYRNGKDLTGIARDLMVIDLFGLRENEVIDRYPDVFRWLYDRVYEPRQALAHTKDGRVYAERWWIFGKPRPVLRQAMRGLSRYIATVETAKHRVFQFLDISILPDNMLVCIASDEAYHLGILSSRIHIIWALAQGGRLGVGDDPRYNKSVCFDTFPFPFTTADKRAEIGAIADEIDKLRKDVLLAHSTVLTLTDLYNVLEKRRARKELLSKEQEVERLGKVAILQHLHHRLDNAVACSYGISPEASIEQILEFLIKLNSERRREEALNKIEWLRPTYQAAALRTLSSAQIAVDLEEGEAEIRRPKWPSDPLEQYRAIRSVLRSTAGPVSPRDIAHQYKGARQDRVNSVFLALAEMGQVVRINNDQYM